MAIPPHLGALEKFEHFKTLENSEEGLSRGDLQRLQSLQTLLGEVELAVSKLGFDHPHTIYLSDIFGSERLTNEGHLHLY